MHSIKLYFDESNIYWQKDHEVNKLFIRQRFNYLKQKLAKNEIIGLSEAIKEFGFYFINPEYFEYGFTKESGVHIKVEKNFMESQEDWVNMQNTTWMIFEVVSLRDYVSRKEANPD